MTNKNKNPVLKLTKESRFTNKPKAELDRRINEYKKGIGKTYTWEETIIETGAQVKTT